MMFKAAKVSAGGGGGVYVTVCSCACLLRVGYTINRSAGMYQRPGVAAAPRDARILGGGGQCRTVFPCMQRMAAPGTDSGEEAVLMMRMMMTMMMRLHQF